MWFLRNRDSLVHLFERFKKKKDTLSLIFHFDVHDRAACQAFTNTQVWHGFEHVGGDASFRHH